VLLKDSEGAIDKQFKDLPGYPHDRKLPAIGTLSTGTKAEPIVAIGYRSFDRQKLIADPRLIHRARADLWDARAVKGQVFVVEQHTKAMRPGPGVVFSALIPDFDYFKGTEGGRTMPFLHADESANLAGGLAGAIGRLLHLEVTAEDVLAYVAGVVSHPAYTTTFAEELQTPGVHVPITADPEAWAQAVSLGEQVLWAQTFGRVFSEPPARSADDIAFPVGDPKRVACTEAVTELPTGVTYDSASETLRLGGGAFAPVTQAMFDYEVGGKNVLGSWIGYRSAEPAGRVGSPLDEITPTAWEHEWTGDFVEVLTALRRLTELEADQQAELERILSGPVLTVDELVAEGVKWPVADGDRIPKKPLKGGLLGD
jgi:hypothetical protein